MQEKINILEYFKNANFNKNLFESMYSDFSGNPKYFLSSEKFPAIKQKILDQQKQSKIYFSEEEKNVVIALLAEVGFTISLLIVIKKKDVVDFDGLIKTSDESVLLREIKLFFIEEFLDTSLEPIREGKVDFSEEDDVPKDLPDVIAYNVKQYCLY